MAEEKKVNLMDLADGASNNEEEKGTEERKLTVDDFKKPAVRPSVSESESTAPKRISMRELAANARASQPRSGSDGQIIVEGGKKKKKNQDSSNPEPKAIADAKEEEGEKLDVVSDLSDLAPEIKMEPVEERNRREQNKGIIDAFDRVKQDLKENVIPKAQEVANQILEQQVLEDNKKKMEESPEENQDTLSELTKDPTVDDEDDLNSLIVPAASVPMQNFKEQTQQLDLSKMNQSVETDEEMEYILKELEDDDNTPAPSSIPDEEPELTPEEEKAQEEWAKDMLINYRKAIKEKLESTDRVHSVKDGKVSISKIPISVSKALQQVQTKTAHTASFPLIHTGRMITMESLTGDEISVLDSRNYESDMEAARAMYGLLYKKDVSPNKPNSWDKWLQSICDWDIFNIYMAVFIATFKDSCYIPFTCPNCSNMFFKEFKIEDLYRKHPGASKDFDARVKSIVESGDNAVPSALVSEYFPISNQFAVGFRAPSIYSATFEGAALDEKFREKHIQAINVAQYIDGVYFISGKKENGELDLYPISFKVDKNNATLTVKMKIITIEKIIQTLTTDETAVFSSKLQSINSKANDRFQFVIPGTTCHEKYGPQKAPDGTNLEGKECGYVIPELVYKRDGGRRSEVNPLDLLFTRHRLTLFGYLEIEL